ncbi:histone deacetylase family protein [Marinomonas epiphytica]
MATAYITHDACEKHQMGAEHPESPARIGAIHDRLIAGQMLDFLHWREAQPASIEQIKKAHDSDYVDGILAQAQLLQGAQGEESISLEPETILMQHSLDAALYAAGAAIQALDMVMKQEVDNAFCSVRPPGHHAEQHQAMGFCFFNNVAVAARYAQQNYQLKRIAIIDFDVHHGNGTEHIVSGDSGIFYGSSYQHPFYPYSDPGKSHDNILHIPLEAGTGSNEFRQAISTQLIPALHQYEPELLLISAGFDAHKADPMGQLRLEDQDFTWITQELMKVAECYSQGRIVSILEGGYDLDALGRAACCHIRALLKMA